MQLSILFLVLCLFVTNPSVLADTRNQERKDLEKRLQIAEQTPGRLEEARMCMRKLAQLDKRMPTKKSSHDIDIFDEHSTLVGTGLGVPTRKLPTALQKKYRPKKRRRPTLRKRAPHAQTGLWGQQDSSPTTQLKTLPAKKMAPVAMKKKPQHVKDIAEERLRVLDAHDGETLEKIAKSIQNMENPTSQLSSISADPKYDLIKRLQELQVEKKKIRANTHISSPSAELLHNAALLKRIEAEEKLLKRSLQEYTEKKPLTTSETSKFWGQSEPRLYTEGDITTPEWGAGSDDQGSPETAVAFPETPLLPYSESTTAHNKTPRLPAKVLHTPKKMKRRGTRHALWRNTRQTKHYPRPGQHVIHPPSPSQGRWSALDHITRTWDEQKRS